MATLYRGKDTESLLSSKSGSPFASICCCCICIIGLVVFGLSITFIIFGSMCLGTNNYSKCGTNFGASVMIIVSIFMMCGYCCFGAKMLNTFK